MTALNEKVDEIVSLFKTDIGIKSDSRDSYYTSVVQASMDELESKGIQLEDTVADMMLVSDYAAYCYRHRAENVAMSKNLTLRIRNRIIKGMCNK